MKSITITKPIELAIRTPPLLVTLCLAMWAVSLFFAFHHQVMSADIEAASLIVAP